MNEKLNASSGTSQSTAEVPLPGEGLYSAESSVSPQHEEYIVVSTVITIANISILSIVVT